MKKTRISELFPYENIVNDKTLKAKVLVWNNRTMLIAEENSLLFFENQRSFNELIEGIFGAEQSCINCLLFAALANGNDDFDIQNFLDYYEEAELPEYTRAIIDGLMNYLPSEELQREIKEIDVAVNSEPQELDDESDHWAFLFYFCKKYFHMTDDEFLNSTWKTISVLQREFLKSNPKYRETKTVSAEFVDI